MDFDETSHKKRIAEILQPPLFVQNFTVSKRRCNLSD